MLCAVHVKSGLWKVEVTVVRGGGISIFVGTRGASVVGGECRPDRGADSKERTADKEQHWH